MAFKKFVADPAADKVTPFTDLFVKDCESVVPTIAPIGAVKLVPHAEPVLVIIPAVGYCRSIGAKVLNEIFL